MVHFISSLKNVVISFHLKGKKRDKEGTEREKQRKSHPELGQARVSSKTPYGSPKLELCSTFIGFLSGALAGN